MSTSDIEKNIRQGRKLFIKSAFIGCIVFPLAEIAIILIYDYFFHYEDTAAFDIVALIALVIYFLIELVVGFALIFLPAWFLGNFLTRLLHKDYKKHRLSKMNAFIKGACIGALACVIVCIPILILQYSFVQRTGHGSFYVFVDRSILATFIASLAGTWSGMKIRKILTAETSKKTTA